MDFEDILNVSMDTVEKPKPFPVGHYTFLITNKELGQSQQKKTPFVSYKCRALAAGDDVDQGDLAAVRGWNEKEMKLDFYLTPDSLFRLKDFAAHCGVDATGMTTRQLIDELLNTTFIGQIGHELSRKDNETIYANIVNTMPAQ